MSDDKKVKAFPKKGQKILLRHRTFTKSTGVAEINVSKDTAIRTITGVYAEPFRVRDSAGEVWEVIPDKSGQAEWTTRR